MYYLLLEDIDTKSPKDFLYCGYFTYKKQAEGHIKSLQGEDDRLRRGHFKILVRDE